MEPTLPSWALAAVPPLAWAMCLISKHGLCPLQWSQMLYLCVRTVSKEQVKKIFFHKWLLKLSVQNSLSISRNLAFHLSPKIAGVL